jgi:hypothetical protein
MPNPDRDGADSSGPQITRPGKGQRDTGQDMDGGRQSEDLRDFPGVYADPEVEKQADQPPPQTTVEQQKR